MRQYFAKDYAGKSFELFGAGDLIEAGWHLWAAYWGIRNIQTMLPLYMCSVMIWSSIYMLLTKHYGVYEAVYFLGIGGAMQALIPTDATGYGFPHFRAFNTFIAHGLLFAIPIYMTVVEGYRPTAQSFKRVFIWTNIYMVFVFFVNLAIGRNYPFIAYKPNFPSLLDLLAAWPWYILQLEIIAFAILSVLYLSFLIGDIRSNLQRKTASNHI
jgi:hypothetical integral membrane protein (TIGR02206 family)